MEWAYYDFDKHWEEFYAVWSSDAVQSVLVEDMAEWCRSEAYYTADGSRPTWCKGEPLWQLSRTDYWDNKFLVESQRIDEETNGPRRYKYFADAMRRAANIEYGDEDEMHKAYYTIVLERIQKSMEPKPGTLESLVLFMGRNYIHEALLTTASLLFGEENVSEEENSEEGLFVVVDDQRLVFDLLGYYFWTRDNDRHFVPENLTRIVD